MSNNTYRGHGDENSGVTVASAFRSLPRTKRIALLLCAAAALLLTALIGGAVGRGTATVPVAQTPERGIPEGIAAEDSLTEEPAQEAATTVAPQPETAPITTEPPTMETTEPTTEEPTTAAETTADANARDYVVNTNTGKFHYPYCSSVGDMNPANRSDRTCPRDDLLAEGYIPCKRCSP